MIDHQPQKNRPLPQQETSLPNDIGTQTPLSQQLNRVGFKKRYMAFVIDHTLAWVIGFPFAFVFKQTFITRIEEYAIRHIGAAGLAIAGSMLEIYALLMGILVGINIAGILYAIMEAVLGFTLGKWIMKMRIRQSNNENADWASLVLRSMIKNGSLILSLLYFFSQSSKFAWLANIAGAIVSLGVFFIFGSKRQTLHDMIADTIVVSVKQDQETEKTDQRDLF